VLEFITYEENVCHGVSEDLSNVHYVVLGLAIQFLPFRKVDAVKI